MKIQRCLAWFLVCSLALQNSFGELSTWVSKDGRAAQLNLLSVSEVDGELAGLFKMSNGNRVTLKASQLDPKEVTRLEALKSSQDELQAIESAQKNDVYRDMLEKNLMVLDGKRFTKVKDYASPTKYYLFYQTASWCPPCQKFTPTLVEFYNEYKSTYSSEFEIVLITSDSSKDAMLEYAVTKGMQWPHLELSDVPKFNKKHPFPGSGIPNTILTDVEGNIIEQSYEGGQYYGPSRAMNKLKKLLDRK